jgi:hypothetical protein
MPLMGTYAFASLTAVTFARATRTEALRPITAALARNIGRIDSLVTLPPLVSSLAYLHGCGTPPPYPPPSIQGWPTDDMQNSAKNALAWGMSFVQGALPAAAWGVEAWLAALLLGTWTTFETLAGDLWVVTLNAHPRELDRLAGKEKRIQSAADAQRGCSLSKAPAAKGQDGEKTIPISAIHDLTVGTYNLGSRMGELLRAKVDFVTLWDIRRAYSLAFDGKGALKALTARVDAALADNALDALAQVRNVIVHKAGIADAFYERNSATLPAMPQAKEGQEVLLDGEVVKNLVSPVFACCMNLITAIDEWLDGASSPPGHGAGI